MSKTTAAAPPSALSKAPPPKTGGGRAQKNWGDEDDDEDFETRVNEHGIKERTRVTENAKGIKVKIVTRIRVTEVKERTPKRVLTRKNIPKFGEAKRADASKTTTMVDKEYTLMEHPNDSLVEEDTSGGVASTLKEFIQKQSETAMARESGVEISFSGDARNRPEGEAAPGPARYVAPGARSGASGDMQTGSSMGGAFNLDAFGAKDTIIRVSNLSKSVHEDDLKDLFEPFGKVIRVKLPRQVIGVNPRTNEEIKEPKGFAYVYFLRSDEAEVAFNKLQGYGYDHLILRLEWAKPVDQAAGGGGWGGGGLSGGHVSGYGTKLAQDTKEKVTYTDTLATALRR